MQIADFESVRNVGSVTELKNILEVRHERNANAFWSSHEQHPDCMLGVLVLGDRAYLTYLPEEGYPGFIPTHGGAAAPPDGLTTFAVSRYSADDVQVPEDAVVDVATAVAAACEFFETGVRPTVVDWFEL